MRPQATTAMRLHAFDCDCQSCAPRTAATALADAGAAGFMVGSVGALLLALGSYPAETIAAVRAVMGLGL